MRAPVRLSLGSKTVTLLPDGLVLEEIPVGHPADATPPETIVHANLRALLDVAKRDESRAR